MGDRAVRVWPDLSCLPRHWWGPWGPHCGPQLLIMTSVWPWDCREILTSLLVIVSNVPEGLNGGGARHCAHLWIGIQFAVWQVCFKCCTLLTSHWNPNTATQSLKGLSLSEPVTVPGALQQWSPLISHRSTLTQSFLFYSFCVYPDARMYLNWTELIKSLSNSDQCKWNPGDHKRQQHWDATLAGALPFVLLTLAAIRRELPGRHIKANKALTKQTLWWQECVFDPGETFKSREQ